jgi:hypothetical protein
MSDDDVKMTAALVEHPPVIPAFAYRFDTADRSIVISGDSAPSDNPRGIWMKKRNDSTRAATTYVKHHSPGLGAAIRQRALQRFHRACAPFEHLSAIVAQELRAGVSKPSDIRALKGHVFRVFERAGRTITPSSAWSRAESDGALTIAASNRPVRRD